MSLMEQQLRKMLKKKLIKTPSVIPKIKTTQPVVVLKEKFKPKVKQLPQNFFNRLIIAAKERTQSEIQYDGSYRDISYPMGDVAANKGVCTDVVIRSYRKLGIDLQQLVHEDIKKHFNLYPSHSRWGNRAPDSNIDHRRVYNLQVFFERYAKSLSITDNPEDYLPGDLVTWILGPRMPHIGIVVDEYSEDHPDHPLIVHNIGEGPKQEDVLFSFSITGHYRYKPSNVTLPIPSSPSLTTLLAQKGRDRSSYFH